jgi:propionyl-CoA synthetase
MERAGSMGKRYDEVYRQSIEQPEQFWGEAAQAVHWERKWDRVINADNPPFYRWFEGGIVNTCYNALDRHVENGRADQVALIYDSPVTKTVKKYSYRELRDLVARCSGGLARLGLRKGDRVIIYMPMVPEAVIAMLACARLGAIHSVVFGGFASRELATRIEDARPKIVISSSCGIEVKRVIPYKPLLDEAIRMSTYKPDACVIVQRPPWRVDLIAGRDMEWTEIMDAEPHPCVPVAATP